MIDLDTTDLATLEAVMATDKGDMVFGFYADHAPNHVKNFADLAQKGFYDGLAFHRIVRTFMIQSGCPQTREGETGIPGTGGPGYHIDAEFNELEHKRGVLSMARGEDPNSAGSQFFLVHAEHATHLDREYTVFAHMKEGLDVLDEIAATAVEFGAGGERSKPVERVAMRSVTVRIAAVEDAPSEDAPSEDVPSEDAPSEDAPSEDAAAEDALFTEAGDAETGDAETGDGSGDLASDREVEA